MDSNRIEFLRQRSAEVHAKCIYPYIQSGGKILDCGCGPGSITIDLATKFPNANFIGMDIDPSILPNSKIPFPENVEFRVGTVYDLQFDESIFDLVFSNALFQHLESPSAAVEEMRRVLSGNGHLCIRVPDWTKLRVTPTSDVTEKAIDRFLEIHYGSRSDPRIGARLEELITDAALSIVSNTTTIEPNEASKMFASFAHKLNHAGYLAEAAQLFSISVLPEATFTQTWREVIATKS